MFAGRSRVFVWGRSCGALSISLIGGKRSGCLIDFFCRVVLLDHLLVGNFVLLWCLLLLLTFFCRVFLCVLNFEFEVFLLPCLCRWSGADECFFIDFFCWIVLVYRLLLGTFVLQWCLLLLLAFCCCVFLCVWILNLKFSFCPVYVVDRGQTER